MKFAHTIAALAVGFQLAMADITIDTWSYWAVLSTMLIYGLVVQRRGYIDGAQFTRDYLNEKLKEWSAESQSEV